MSSHANNLEIERRDSTATARRAREAGLESDMVIERWDDSAMVTFDRKVLSELMCLRFIESRRNVVILGPVGVGKRTSRRRLDMSHVGIAFRCT